MSDIWTFASHLPGSVSRIGLDSRMCPHCATVLEFLGAIEFGPVDRTRVWACPACGWWKLLAVRDWSGPMFIPNVDAVSTETRYAHSTLRNFSVRDWTGPMADLQRFLLVRREVLGEVPPRLVEETVADVFRNLGFTVELTAYSKDGGIDLFVSESAQGERIAVQVKRLKRRVDVDLVRSFVGAMTFQRITRGIYVATNGYTRDARALQASDVVAIELRDGDWLLDALRITRRPAYESIHDESAPFWKLTRDVAAIPLIDTESFGVERRWPE